MIPMDADESAIFVCLDNRGLEYLKGRLANANPLGQRILAEVALEAGTVWTILPCPALYNFGEAIGAASEVVGRPSPRGITCKAALKRVVAALNVCPECSIVCESYSVRLSDIPPAVLEGRQEAPYLPGHTGHVGEFVYHLASGNDPESIIRSVIYSAYEQPVGLCVIFRSNHAPFSVQGDDVTLILDDVVPSVAAVFVSAYDGEGFVIWQSPTHRIFT